MLIIFGWPHCGYAKRAINFAQENNLEYIFVDITEEVPEFLKKIHSYGSGNGQWASPHIFEYKGGFTDLTSPKQQQIVPEGCVRLLDKIVCSQ